MIDLSIHLITYNNEKYIEETLQSILKQKVNFNFEIVIGDDCSTDNTLKIITSYQKKHPSLFKIKKNETQLGILKNFKTTLDRCQGKYVFDLAGDDLLKHEYSLQKMVDVLKSDSSLGFVDSGVDIYQNNTKTTKPFQNKKAISLNAQEYIQLATLGQITPIGVCFNKNALYKFVDFDSYFNMGITIEDYPILVDLAMNTNFKKINESLHVYRVHDASYSHYKTFENHFFLKEQMKCLFEYFKVKYDFKETIQNTFYQNHYKELLFLSCYFDKKQIGKEAFNNLKNKSFKDYILYLASQNPLFKKMSLLLKKRLFK